MQRVRQVQQVVLVKLWGVNMITVDKDTGEVIGPFVRSAYNYDMDEVSEKTGLCCEDPTMAQQQFAEECDINTIVERFGITGQLPSNGKAPMVGDFIEVQDYQSALNALIAADAEFMKMPAEIRAQFQNDAGKFVDFVSDAKNIEQVDKWGLSRPGWMKPESSEIAAGESVVPTSK